MLPSIIRLRTVRTSAFCLLVMISVLGLVRMAPAQPATPAAPVRTEVARSLAVAAGGVKAWPLRLRRAVVKTVSTYKGDLPHTATEEILLASVGVGLVRAQTIDSSGRPSSDATSVYGLVEVATLVTSGAHSMRRVVTDFFADSPITSLATGATFSFRQKVLMIEDDNQRATSLYRTACKVGPLVQASTLHGSLTGEAVSMDCTTTADGKPANQSRGFLLPGLGWYFQESFETSFHRSRSSLVQVEPF